jgi:hypothetical protein
MSGFRAAIAALAVCATFAAHAGESPDRPLAGVQSRSDGQGTTTYWGEGAQYEITGPGVTLFVLTRDDGATVPPLLRVVYVGGGWINIRGVTFTVGERTFGPYADGFGKPSRVEADHALVVEALVLNVDTEEKWQMLEGIAEAADLGRPVIAVFEADAPYGMELDRASKRATGTLLRSFRDLSVRSH